MLAQKLLLAYDEISIIFDSSVPKSSLMVYASLHLRQG